MYDIAPAPHVPPSNPHYSGRTGKPRVAHSCSFRWPRRGKYSQVARALPYPSSEKKCRWKRQDTPDGRRRLIAIP